MSQAIVKQDKINNIRDLITSQKEQIGMALPRHMSVDRLARIAITTIRTTPRLLECDTYSLLGAVIKAAQLGLEPDGTLGHAYLIPYGKEATLQIGYQGLMALAERTGKVKMSPPRIVYEEDFFEYEYGLDEKLIHRPAMKNAGKPVYAYAIAKIDDDHKVFDVMSVDEINAIRDRAQAKNSGPWKTDWAPMAKKTVLKRLLKYVPKSVELASAVAIDSIGEAGKPQYLRDLIMDEGQVIEAEVAEEKAKVVGRQEELADKVSGKVDPTADFFDKKEKKK